MKAQMTEKEMYAAKAPKPETQEDLIAYINSLVEMDHDYGTCVYAMSMAAVATFNYVAGKLGVTGFQASCADMDILRRTRNMEVFKIVNYEDCLYPQYEEKINSNTVSEETAEWLVKRAKENLEKDGSFASTSVIKHWEKIAAGNLPFGMKTK